MATGAGSLCVAKSRPKREATVVEKLRKAGAIILGKTNLSEFSGARGPFPSGWSSRGNQTFGAYVEFQTACGSSSGSGVAASLGLAAAALGTETSGSITCPASLNNVVGIKPTMGLTSRFGVVPITIRQDTTGPLAQSVADAALILDAIAGPDANDNYTLIQPPHVQGSYSAALNESALQGKRIGAVFYEHNVWNNSGLAANMKQAKRLFDAALADLEVAGAEVIRIDLGFHGVPLNESLLEIGNNSMNYVLPDFAEGLLKYMEGTLPDHRAPKTLQELLECIENTPAERATEFDPDIVRRAANTTATAGSAESWASYTTAKSISREILLSPLKEHNLDGLATFMDISIVLAAAPGLPIVTVPMGAIGADGTTVWDIYNKTVAMAPGMPLGLTFVGDQWSERTLIGYAYAYEQVSKKRQTLSPYLKIDADLDSIMAVLEPKDL
ncbi:amidase signature enzyme [Thozetella sp. PMI_491]|nr:amidase signature enzyme [Thozetella sp. PMI_491]